MKRTAGSEAAPGSRVTAWRRLALAALGILLPVAWSDAILGAPARLSNHVIIVVVDGPRLAESFDVPSNVPRMSGELIPQGAYFTEFYNDGRTLTCSGHSSILTGRWQYLANDGSELPHDPTVFEWYRSETGAPRESCWVMAGKTKLHMLTHSDDPGYGASWGAVDSSGLGGDVATMEVVLGVLEQQRPTLCIVNLPDTDGRGHAEDYPGYVAAIAQADSLIGVLWDFLKAHPDYADDSTLIVTADHGRHDDRPAEPYDGFKSHGDGCHGCRHIPLLMVGAGIASVGERTMRRDQRDVGATVSRLLGLATPSMAGFPLYEALEAAVASGVEISGPPRILGARPSPFVAGGGIELALQPGAPGRLEIFDSRGRRVRSLTSPPGREAPVLLIWDGKDEAGAPVASGSYFLRLLSRSRRDSGRLILLR